MLILVASPIQAYSLAEVLPPNRYTSRPKPEPVDLIIAASVYLFSFLVFDYIIKYVAGVIINLSKRPRWAHVALQMNLATHPVLIVFCFLCFSFLKDYQVSWFFIVTVLLGIAAIATAIIIEALLLQRWCHLHQTIKQPSITFPKALKLSLGVNLISLLMIILIIGIMYYYAPTYRGQGFPWLLFFSATVLVISIATGIAKMVQWLHHKF